MPSRPQSLNAALCDATDPRPASEHSGQQLRVPVEWSSINLIHARMDTHPAATAQPDIDHPVAAAKFKYLRTRYQVLLTSGSVDHPLFSSPHPLNMSPHSDKSLLCQFAYL